jgi:hypothetical protein
MNEIQGSARLKDRPTKSRPASARPSCGSATFALIALIVSTMLVWFGFLGWGIIALLQTLFDYFRDFWAT